MAIQFADKSALPVATRGREATDPKVSVSEMGRIVFNKLASDKLKEMKAVKIVMGYDPEKGLVALWPVTAEDKEGPFKVPLAKCFDLNFGKDGLGKSGIAVNNSTPQLRAWDYRFKDAGNQTFLVKFGTISKVPGMAFGMPVGENTPKALPKADHKPRKAKAATAGATSAPSVASGAEDDLVME